MIYRQAPWVRLEAEAEWCAAVIRQRRLFFVESEAVGPAVHIHHRRIRDIRRPETETDDYFAITAKAPLRHRNATFPGKYTDRDQQMRLLEEPGGEYVVHDDSSGADLKGWLLR